jgi:hypothetical protein
MQWLNKLPNSVRSASGLEWALWRKLPLIFAVGTAVPVLLLGLLHLLAADGALVQPRNLQIIDYVVVGVVLFHWSAVATLAIGCAVVMLMKGPGYVADGFDVSHSDRPRTDAESEWETLPPQDDKAP